MRQLLSPFERNCLVLAARYGGNLRDVADALKGGVEQFDDENRPTSIRGRSQVTVPQVEAALERARVKIARRRRMMERQHDGTEATHAVEPENGNGNGDVLDREEAEEAVREADGSAEPPLLGRPGAPRLRSADPEAAKQARTGGPLRTGRRKPGQRQREIVELLAEQGPLSQVAIRQRLNISSSVIPAMMRGICERGLIRATGEQEGKSKIFEATDAGRASLDATAGTAAEPVGKSGEETAPAPPPATAPDPAPGGELRSRYIDALLTRIENGHDCPDYVYERIENFIFSR